MPTKPAAMSTHAPQTPEVPPAATAAATQPDTLSYEVISPLHHDGQAYAIGELVNLTERQAAPLLGHTVRLPALRDAAAAESGLEPAVAATGAVIDPDDNPSTGADPAAGDAA